MKKPFQFHQPKGYFKVVVFAKNLKNARQYVKNHSNNSLAWRALKYLGEGHPSNAETWLGAVSTE